MSLARQFNIGTAPEIKRTAAKKESVAQPSATTVRNHPVAPSARPVTTMTVTRAEFDALMARVAELEKASAIKPAKRDRAAYHREYRKRSK